MENYYDFLKEVFNMDVPIDKRSLAVELAKFAWNGKDIAEQNVI